MFGLGLVTAIDRPGNAGNEDWLSGIIGLIAFFIGGYFASIISRDEDSAPSAGRDARPALLNGLLVWALGTVLILALCALGLGQIFGALGDVVDQSRALGEPSNVIDPLRIADAIKSSALGAFFSLLVWALASAVGDWLGSRTGTRAGRATSVERRRH